MNLADYQKNPANGAAWIGDQAIGLFLEYRDVHGYDEGTARRKALEDVRDGVEALFADAEQAP